MDEEKLGTVWVAQKTPGFDYGPAKRFGSIEFVIEDPGPISPQDVLTVITNHSLLEDFQPDEDFFVLTGSPLIMSLVFAILYAELAALGYRGMTVLQYDKAFEIYRPVFVPIV